MFFTMKQLSDLQLVITSLEAAFEDFYEYKFSNDKDGNIVILYTDHFDQEDLSYYLPQNLDVVCEMGTVTIKK